MKKADKVVIHEGLPHPLTEEAAFDAKKRNPNVVRPRRYMAKAEADAHSFYDPPQAARDADAKALTALLTSPDVV